MQGGDCFVPRNDAKVKTPRYRIDSSKTMRGMHPASWPRTLRKRGANCATNILYLTLVKQDGQVEPFSETTSSCG